MSADISPADAVDVDDLERSSQAAAEATADHAAAEGVDASSSSGLGSSASLQEMLLSTEPSRPLDQVEAPWDPEHGGPARIMRAAQKAAGIDGLPAIVDAVIGVLETLSTMDETDGREESDRSDGELPAIADLDGRGV
jgi:hypothetical protein